MWHWRHPRGMENWHYCQASKERWSWGLQKLAGDNIAASHKQSLQQDHPQTNFSCNREHCPPGTSWFQKREKCVDHIFTLRQIFEQSAEWNSTIYANFIDFEKAFDSFHRESLWKILWSYGFPQKMVNIIKLLYRDFECKVICTNLLTDSFSITREVKQGCILSPVLFTVAMDWLVKVTTTDSRRGIRWTLTTYLEDLD